MSDRPQQATLAEIYEILNQLVEAYTQVMEMFQAVVLQVGETKAAVEDIRAFVNNEYTDAKQTAAIWQHNAKLHRQQAQDLKDKLKTLEAVAGQIGVITEHHAFIAAKSGALSAGIIEAESPPPDFKVYVHNEVEGSDLMVVDETLDA